MIVRDAKQSVKARSGRTVRAAHADEPLVITEKPSANQHNLVDSDAIAMLGWERATRILLAGLDRLEALEAAQSEQAMLQDKASRRSA